MNVADDITSTFALLELSQARQSTLSLALAQVDKTKAAPKKFKHGACQSHKTTDVHLGGRMRCWSLPSSPRWFAWQAYTTEVKQLSCKIWVPPFILHCCEELSTISQTTDETTQSHGRFFPVRHDHTTPAGLTQGLLIRSNLQQIIRGHFMPQKEVAKGIRFWKKSRGISLARMGFWKGLGDSSIFTIQLHFDFWCPYPRVTGATSLASLAAPEAFSTLRSLRGSSYGSHEFVERTGTAAILQGTLVSVLGQPSHRRYPKRRNEELLGLLRCLSLPVTRLTTRAFHHLLSKCLHASLGIERSGTKPTCFIQPNKVHGQTTSALQSLRFQIKEGFKDRALHSSLAWSNHARCRMPRHKLCKSRCQTLIAKCNSRHRGAQTILWSPKDSTPAIHHAQLPRVHRSSSKWRRRLSPDPAPQGITVF